MSDSGLRDENRSIRVEKDAISSAIISGDGNKVVIYQYQLEHQLKEEKVSTTGEIGANPYKGLLAFLEVDGERYFGREKQIEKLWNLFRTLHENTTQPETSLRLLPILGPSGSGKSSLARAGLIPELARRPLPGKSQARVAVLVPGTHPVEALATVLARVATNDQTPVAKTREFAQELKQTSSNTTDTIIYDGLRRIANVLPEITVSPLVVLVDQFEEVYSLCDDPTERQIFIENLIHAAGDRSGCVSVIITLRSDFLGETQRHPALNQAIAKLGVIVPAIYIFLLIQNNLYGQTKPLAKNKCLLKTLDFKSP
ncbi:ATP-binding protein [Mastigocladopsis repens]|uniref:ATP-binding protein n=1 Tax=Mastigocladopsis repens TaxID=221287 RepID=UPI00031C0977|nr:ATP-binding protein [Mastigocladopsis repens]